MASHGNPKLDARVDVNYYSAYRITIRYLLLSLQRGAVRKAASRVFLRTVLESERPTIQSNPWEASVRLILIGTEYVGKTTLANALQEWGLKVGKRFHMDDGDFTIPDYHHLNEEDQQTMWNMSAVLKERFQRMVIYYHLEILERYNDCIFGGFHIEEKIFGPRYYHPGSEVSYHRWLEHKMPDNSILVLMTCDPDVVRQRMVDDPHPYELVKSHEIEEIMDEFLYEYNSSYFRQKVEFDTTNLTPEGILQPFLEAVRPQVDARDLIFLDSLRK